MPGDSGPSDLPKSLPSKRLGMEPVVGIEPTTDGLQNRCSTAELNWPAEIVARVSKSFKPDLKASSNAPLRTQAFQCPALLTPEKVAGNFAAGRKPGLRRKIQEGIGMRFCR